MPPDRHPNAVTQRGNPPSRNQPSPDAQHIATAIREAAVTVSEAILAAGERRSREEIAAIVSDAFDARQEQAHEHYRAGAA